MTRDSTPDLPHAIRFIAESNRIEGITTPPRTVEVSAHQRLWWQPAIAVIDVERFVRDVANSTLRRRPGQDVRVGNHVPPPGGPAVERGLERLLSAINLGTLAPFEVHQEYEYLYPFLDGNGRSGRALWAWQMINSGNDPFALPFLHRHYYQSLAANVAAKNPPAAARTNGADLTAREARVLHWAARGLSNSEIGAELYITEDTVKTFMRRVFVKLGVGDRTLACMVAAREGLLPDWPVPTRTPGNVHLPAPGSTYTGPHIGACEAARRCPCRQPVPPAGP